MSIERLRFTLEALTPCFLGGADPRVPACAPAAVKGVLRFWYRAVALAGGDDGGACDARVFGSTAGQGPFLLRWSAAPPRRYPARQLQRDAEPFNEGHGRNQRNGLRYLGYPFFLGDNRSREAWAPGSRFELEAVFPRGATAMQRRGLAASVWLLGHLGGLGTRARRGFGAVQLVDWEAEGEALGAVLEALPLLARVAQVAQWEAGLRKAREQMVGWFGTWRKEAHYAHHPHLGPSARYWLGVQGEPDWRRVMNALGRRLQDFRVRREPDYSDMKAYLERRARLRHAPQRVAFGLPLAFRYSGVQGSVEFVPARKPSRPDSEAQRFERWPSLLHLRPVRIGGRLHPWALRMSGPVPGQRQDPFVTMRRGRPWVLYAQKNLLDEFMENLGGTRPWMR